MVRLACRRGGTEAGAPGGWARWLAMAPIIALSGSGSVQTMVASALQRSTPSVWMDRAKPCAAGGRHTRRVAAKAL
ncbi:hypothetical protein GLA29479_1840 [Lysobacter antibioticus]|nr:hypothetical protein GLA29479_1840 [Lysobacter antibioticus]